MSGGTRVEKAPLPALASGLEDLLPSWCCRAGAGGGGGLVACPLEVFAPEARPLANHAPPPSSHPAGGFVWYSGSSEASAEAFGLGGGGGGGPFEPAACLFFGVGKGVN